MPVGQSVYYYGIRCTYEFYNGIPVFVAVASYDNELFSSHQFSYIEGRWAHFLSSEEELTMRAVPPNGSIVFDKTADKLCTAALILFVCHLPILLLVSFIHSIGAFAVSFLVLISSVVLVSIVRSKYPYNKLAKTLGIVIAVTFFIEMFIFITLAVMCNMAVNSCIYNCNNCHIPG